ncbi:MAG TPA: thrombospondin type 3 repeat-containing protein [Polyangia bacterium]|nr:thrombospondin type 3 repeat-containing protein [Polyangia bacterium]
MTHKPWLRPTLTLGITFCLLATSRSSWAQAPAGIPHDSTIDTQLFEQAIGPGNFVTVDAPDIARHKQLGFGLALSYQWRPYVVYTKDTGVQANVVEHQATAELTASMALFDRFQIGLALPYTPVLKGQLFDAVGVPTGQDQTARGLGDLRLEAKTQLAVFGADEEFGVGLLAGISIPTAKLGGASLDVPVGDSGPYYLGDKNFTGRIKGIFGVQKGPVRAAANLGVLLRESSQSFAAVVGHQLLYGAAAAFEVRERVELMVELYGRSGLTDFTQFYSDVNPFEADAALRIGVTSMLSIAVGGGRGFGKGIGAPAGRGFLAVGFSPDFRDRDHDGIYDVDDHCPDQAEDLDGFQDKDGCPDNDNDNDGIPDAQDKCPNAAEDVDQFEDEDGCPDPDNDKDGITDLDDACPNAAEDGHGKRPTDGCPSTSEDSDGDGVNDTIDKCPDEPEDRDGFEDADGCPEPDNDNDGIPDNFDNCPNAAEDMDGFEDDDGCPDPDDDKDGIPDAQDRCPRQPETLNGIKDDDGCPDAGAPLVHLTADRIELEERIGFSMKGGKSELRDAGVNALGLVALVLKGHPEIKKVRIEVRSVGISKEEMQHRANIVRDALVKKGIDGARLTPVAIDGGTGARVDFVFETLAPAAKPALKGAPAPAPAAPPEPATP